MAIGHLHTTVVQRSAGQSAVSAAAYAARVRMIDARTGTIYDYSRKQSDVVFSFVGMPKGAPDQLFDLTVFANAMEARETRKNSQTARKFIMALPDELTPQQREWLVKDFGRENFTRKGLAYHVAIHRPHAYGDQRNVHAHWTVSTRVMEKGVFTDKYREGNSKEALLEWRDNWEKLVNRHLERHGHTARISMKSLEAQGIDRTPQIHLGQGASALERKGKATDRGELLRSIANDNEQGREIGIELVHAAEPQPEIIDRDAQDAEWQDSIDSAGIAYAEERRRQFLQTQAIERETYERQGQEMAARHAAAWHEIFERHNTAETAYQPGTAAEAEQAVSGGLSFFLSFFASFAESITRSVTNSRGRPSSASPDKAKQREADRRREQQKQQQAQELEAMQAEQAREKAAFERRRAAMLFQQSQARNYYDEQATERSSLQQAFDVHTAYGENYLEAMKDKATRQEARQERERGGPEHEGPELGG